MESARFDDLAKTIGSSRRGVLKGLIGAGAALSAGVVGLHGADAAARKRATGSTCSKNADCTSGYCGVKDSTGRRYCQETSFQSFNLGGFSCPTGATGFTYTAPLDPESPVQAEQACEQCYGHTCYGPGTDCAGPSYCPTPEYQGQDGEACFSYASGCSGDDGRIYLNGMSFTTYGYWGK